MKAGHRVAWHDSATDQGTIIATDWSGVQIEWDNGMTQFLHHNNMTELSSAPVCSKNLSSGVFVVKSAEDGV